MSLSRSDAWLDNVVRLCAGISLALVFLILGFLLRESIPALRDIGIGRFFSDPSWNPLSELYNLIPMIAATALTSFAAMLIATPFGIASAVFSHFFAPKPISLLYRRLVELLAGIPSVVFGLWGLVVLVPIIARYGGSGQSLLAASLILALMILPTIALTSYSALRAVPHEWIAGGAALGLDRKALAWRIALPAARHGIGVGLLLALARALGETMAVLMIAGNVVKLPESILDPVRTLTANIALEMGYATSSHRSILFVSGLILLSLVIFGVLVSEVIARKRNG